MAFDPSTAKPEGAPEFDAATARPLVSAYEKQAKADSNMENLNAAIGGTLYAPWLGVKAMTGNATPQDVQQWKDSMAGLWSTPMGKVGTVAGGMAAMAPAIMASGTSVPAAAATGAVYGALQPESDWLSRVKNAIIGAAGSAIGQAGGNALASKTAEVAAAPKVLTPKEESVAAANAAGLKVAPNEAGQQSALQWVGGQIKTQQTMASKNVSRATDLAAQEVGLPPGPITRDALQGVRDTAGQAYQPVADAGTIPTDAPMQQVASGIESAYQRLTQSFKSLKSPEIETLIADLKNPTFDSQGLVEAIKRFRSDGFANMVSTDPGKKALGRVQLQAQDALEALADRYLTAQGMPDAVAALQSARQTIAKTYSVQNALDANGNVIASKLASQMTKGKPLSGNLETIAQAAAAFPKSMQHFTANPPAFSALDFMSALLSGGKEAAMLGARPIARAIAASGPYQDAFMQPGSNAGAALIAGVANNPYLRLAETTVLPAGLLAALPH